jgi:hypothetical protein
MQCFWEIYKTMPQMVEENFPLGYQKIEAANVQPGSLTWLYQYIEGSEIWQGELITLEFYRDITGTKYAAVGGAGEGYLLREVCLPATGTATVLSILAGVAVITVTAMLFLPGGKKWRRRKR